ncbi:hypothetical protein PENSPDRAFT_672163 [Peniophora sp. CONT]|nr:hypothetical protein PENSPDRAFT_672163 [Peniophora sp. CONT]
MSSNATGSEATSQRVRKSWNGTTSEAQSLLLAEYDRADAHQGKLDLHWAYCMATLQGRRLQAAHQEHMRENAEWLQYMRDLRERMANGFNEWGSLAPHVRRDLNRKRWSQAPAEHQLHVREEVERQYAEAMEKYNNDASLQQHQPATPEEAANWAEDFGPVLGRAGQVFADGVKGCFFAMMASPRMTDDGQVEMEVSTVEWASIPKELGRRTFNYSSIDKKMVAKLTSRFKYFGEKIFDANWTAEQFKRDAICRDLVEREASGQGVMDEPSAPPAVTPVDSQAIAEDGPSKSSDNTPPRLRASTERQPLSAGGPLSQARPPPPEVTSSPSPVLPPPPRVPSPATGLPPPPPQDPPPAPELSAPTRQVSHDSRSQASHAPASKGKAADLHQRSPAAVNGGENAGSGEQAINAELQTVSSEYNSRAGLQTVFNEYDSRLGIELSPLQDTSAFGLSLTSAMKALQGLPNDEAMFSGKAGWRKMIIEANDNCAEDGWKVDTRIVQNLLTEYLKFEAEGPPAARSAFEGWSHFSLEDEASQMRPVWLVKFYAKDKFAARWCEIGSRERPDPGSWTLEWNFGTALTMQWAALQPEQRRFGSFELTRPPQQDMDWQGHMEGGKMGVRTFVASLLMWAHVLPSCEDGTTSADWELLACDCIRVMRVRREQEMTADRGSNVEGGQVAKIGGRKRPKSAKARENDLNGELSGGEKDKATTQPRTKKRKMAGV